MCVCLYACMLALLILFITLNLIHCFIYQHVLCVIISIYVCCDDVVFVVIISGVYIWNFFNLCTIFVFVYVRVLLTTQYSFFSVGKDGKEMIWQFLRFTTCCQTYQLKIIPQSSRFLITREFLKHFSWPAHSILAISSTLRCFPEPLTFQKHYLQFPGRC